MKQLPEGLPPLPPNAVYLGKGPIKLGTVAEAFFSFIEEYNVDWQYSYDHNGQGIGNHYAAYADSEIAKLNGLVPEVKEEGVTPETDAACQLVPLENFVYADTARRFERERDAALAKVKYAESLGIRFGIMKSSDRPEPYLAHFWEENSDYERMFLDWSHSIGWEDSVKKAEKERDDARKERDELKQELATCMKERDHWHQESMADAEELEQWKEVSDLLFNRMDLLWKLSDKDLEAINAYRDLKHKETKS